VVADPDIKAAARGALELTTPGTVTAGPAIVLLMPSVVARLADVALAPLLTTAAWGRVDLAPRRLVGQAIGAPVITVKFDPDPARYGGYHFDDEGVVARAAAVIDAGVLRGPVGDRRGAAAVTGSVAGGGLRPGHSGVVRAAIGHIGWAPGPGVADPDLLISELDSAWVVDDAGAAHVDPVAWTVTIEVGRARRVAKGAFTGHVHAGVELTAAVPELLASATRVSSTLESFVVRDGTGADVRWRSLEVPAVATRATLAPRRQA
jgi:predicted Zn-dependent protease